ncbi:hypothetical protein [Alkalicoccus daliensis]|uniref:Uncharacterized protein n=1 Tax=Alkalicoccus daliensis TaxID=745820 RepID=A0A1H0HVX0_9BACI|nr:hypothetical protein [Alkalicoccus daliensis]SDO23274.1 hypothetical protein SAMN04488053_10964 [Alkalicoccus daliensis]
MPIRQKKKYAAGCIAVLLLCAIPFFTHIYYLPIYVSAVAVITIWLLGEAVFHKKLEERFYYRWSKIRNWPHHYQLARSVVLYLFFITTMLLLGRLFANGTPPAMLIREAQIGDLLLYTAVLILLSGYMGSSVVKQNEKKYQQLEEEKQA